MAINFDPVNGIIDTGTAAWGIPRGTTAERPANVSNGYMRFNTTLGVFEMYIGVGWVSIASASGAAQGTPYSIDYLVVAGGGSGGNSNNGGGGGGAGGLLNSTLTIYTGTAYPIVIGAGGTVPLTTGLVGTNGVASSFGSLVSTVGGGGGATNSTYGVSGGSGG